MCGRCLAEEASGRRKVEERDIYDVRMGKEWLEGGSRGDIRGYTSVFEENRRVWETMLSAR